jgi:osmotically-inducible protein OsmY
MKTLAAAAVVAALLTGCSQRPARVDLGVDLYLHPQSGSAEDLILQAAIRKKIAETLPKNAGVVYVRVESGIVFLTGAVKSEAAKAQAREAAEKVDVRLDGAPLKPKDVHAEGVTVGS